MNHMKPINIKGKRVEMVGLPMTLGSKGLTNQTRDEPNGELRIIRK